MAWYRKRGKIQKWQIFEIFPLWPTVCESKDTSEIARVLAWSRSTDEKGAYFVTRLKRNNSIKELTLIQKHTDIVSSQLIQLNNKYLTHSGKNRCSDKILRRVIVQREGRTPLILVTNDLNRSSEEIAELYKQRWQIELFFKWIKGVNVRGKRCICTIIKRVKMP